MQPKLQSWACYNRPAKPSIIKTITRKLTYVTLLLFMLSFVGSQRASAQWQSVKNLAPDDNLGVMLLLSNGTVLCHTNTGAKCNILTPDASGSYAMEPGAKRALWLKRAFISRLGFWL